MSGTDFIFEHDFTSQDGKHLAEIMQRFAAKQDALCAQVEGLTLQVAASMRGFPGSDAESHRRYHETMIEEQIYAALADCTIAIRAKDWFDLNDPIVEDIYVDLPPKAMKAYREMEKKLFMQLNGVGIEAFIHRQLEYDPLNSDKKRVCEFQHAFTLAYRTWRIDFTFSENVVGVLAIRSGYSAEELNTEAPKYEDPYQDKGLHQKYNSEFN